MLFGRWGGNATDVKADELYVILNSSFDRKLKALGQKTDGMLRELDGARDSYARACESFAAHDAEPETDDFYTGNIGVLKEQKNAYSKALIRILGEWNSGLAEGPNLYERWSLLLSRAEHFVEETLRANSKFKQVLYSYSRHIGDIKRSFSSIERQRDLLKRALDKMGKEFFEYNALNGQLAKLRSLKEELEMTIGVIGSLSEEAGSESRRADEEAEEAKLAAELAEKEKGLKELNERISASRGEMGRLTAPLERIARKFDHLSARRTNLSSFMTDPSSRIRDENDCRTFELLLTELKKSVESGTAESKNNPKTMESLSELMNANLYGMISERRAMEAERTEFESAIRFSRSALERLRKGESSKAAAASERESMKASEKSIASRISETKSLIEKLFLDYYKQRIRIVD